MYAEQKYKQNVQPVMLSDFHYVKIMASLTDADFYGHFICIVSAAAACHINSGGFLRFFLCPLFICGAYRPTSHTHILFFFLFVFCVKSKRICVARRAVKLWPGHSTGQFSSRSVGVCFFASPSFFLFFFFIVQEFKKLKILQATCCSRVQRNVTSVSF